MEKCIFCDIVHKKEKSYPIYEDPHTLAFLDISQDVDAHIIVIPKKHVRNIAECDGRTLSYLIIAVKKISKHCLALKEFNGFNLLNANFPSAGQSVFHLHFHLILRKDNDGIDAWMKKTPGSKVSLPEMQQRLKMTES